MDRAPVSQERVRPLMAAEMHRAAFLSLTGLMMVRLFRHHARPLSQKAPGPASLVEWDRLLERWGCGTATVAREWNFARRQMEKDLSPTFRV